MTSPVLRLDGVSKQFNDGDETIQALAETDLSLNRGEFVGILGPSGSGKSTLLTIMGGLRTPSTGEVIIDDQPFSALPEKKRARMRFAKLGFVLQASGLVPFLTVGDQFVLHGKVDHAPLDRARRDELLESLKIPRYVDAYPGDLSGGERQRVAIATALYHDPEIVLADEPTASLDTEKAFDVAEILADQTHSRGKCTVMVTHDERLVDHCDRVLRMADGVLTEITNHEPKRGVFGPVLSEVGTGPLLRAAAKSLWNRH
ncbi:ABC transporter ATP-binding protein [Cutibacterium avidum]|uniref:ABC transporter ATP-binding protein n=1 Tax=Cutibacterium avidum TaxID=33010 RepID=UPI00083E701E|nr:ABC transporter ATP-binding protein [Cutibacterium avidum]AOG27793.1 hemin ABC transporter ATP-binding protein [Cutibacterium avidum]